MSIKQAVLADLNSGHLAEVIEGPYPEIEDDQILIKSVAFAGNPSDNMRGEGWGYVGHITGSDVAGVVHQVGTAVSGFQVGDVVSTAVRGNITKNRGGFAQFVIADPTNTIRYAKGQIVDKVLPVGHSPSGPVDSYERAASITTALVTVGTSFASSLNIPFDKSKNSNKYILIWGGASGTGGLAIQVAKLAYGLKVIVTASKKNEALLKAFGADAVFDYNNKDVVSQIKSYAKGKIAYALVAVPNPRTFQDTYDATGESKEVTIDNLLSLQPDILKTDPARKVKFVTTSAFRSNGKPQRLGHVILTASKEVLDAYNKFWNTVIPEVVPKIHSLPLRVLERGLESADESLRLYNENKVSGEKVVFRI